VNIALRPAVTTVKKNVPPGTTARRSSIAMIENVGSSHANPT